MRTDPMTQHTKKRDVDTRSDAHSKDSQDGAAGGESICHRIRLRLPRAHYTLEVDLTLPSHGITVLFGESGSGKTSVLRCVAGLERAHGYVQIGAQVWQDNATGVFLPTWKRQLGYVFQEASLFAHLSVAQNLAYGLRRSRPQPGQSHQNLDEIVDLLGIARLLERRPSQLSGGERQRVAIARALAAHPRVLLLDEPLASLDVARRKEIMPWLERLRDTLSIPMIYVTHSLEELERLADHVVVMQQGRCVASDRLDRLVASGSIALLADLDHTTLLQGQIVEHNDRWQMAQVQTAAGLLWVPHTREPGAVDGLKHDSPLRLRIKARDIVLATDGAFSGLRDSGDNALAGVVESIDPDPANDVSCLVKVRCCEQTLIARISRKSAHDLALRPGLSVAALIRNITVHTTTQ